MSLETTTINNNNMLLTTTGIDELDRLLSGGIPRGSTALILCEGQNAQDASALLGIISLNLLERDENIILLSTDPPTETYPQLYAPNVTAKALRENRLFYIDLFSASMGVQTSEESNIVVVEKPHDLNHVFYHTSMFRDDKLKGIPAPGLKVSWIYHQLSTTIFTVGDSEKVLRFIWNLRSKIKTLRDVMYTVMNADMHPKTVVETAKHIFDTVIELKTIEKDGAQIKYLRVLKNTGLPCITDLVTYSVDVQNRNFRLASEMVTSFEELRKMFNMDTSGILKIPLYDELTRYLVMPANQILNIIKKSAENNHLNETKDAFEYAGYQNGKALAKIFKEKYKLQEKEIAEKCIIASTILGWGSISSNFEDKLEIKIMIKNSPIISSLRTLNKPICFIQKGFIRGVVETAFDSHYQIEETKCVGMGDECCEFVATKAEVVESLPHITNLESIELVMPLIAASEEKLEEFKENVIQKSKQQYSETELTFEKLPEKLPDLLKSCGFNAKFLKKGKNYSTYQISDCRYQSSEKILHNICTTFIEAVLEAAGIKTRIRMDEEAALQNKCILKINTLP